MMFTTDIALIKDPAYLKISKRFHDNPSEFDEAFAKAWYKLTHRDMGPVSCLLGPDVPEPQLWQDPVPRVDHAWVDEKDVAQLKTQILKSGLSVSQLVSTAWASSRSEVPTSREEEQGSHSSYAQKDWKIKLKPNSPSIDDP